MQLSKSIILASAASLIAVGGAQAADLPVKAKAVEYVKVCSLYGPGFYYIPGSDTCIKLGGYLRVDVSGEHELRQHRQHLGCRRCEQSLHQRLHLALPSGFEHRHAHRDRIRRGSHLLRCDLQLDHG